MELAKQADELQCDQETLKAIQERWEVAVDLQHAMREYREKFLSPSTMEWANFEIEEAVLRYRKMLSLEPPAKRSWLGVKSWVEGKIGVERGPSQFSRGTGIYTVFGRPSDEDEPPLILRDLVSLRSTAADDPVSKKVAKKIADTTWIFKFAKV